MGDRQVFMRNRILNAHAHVRGVVLRYPKHTTQLRFRNGSETVLPGDVGTKAGFLQIVWKPTPVLSRDFSLR